MGDFIITGYGAGVVHRAEGPSIELRTVCGQHLRDGITYATDDHLRDDYRYTNYCERCAASGATFPERSTGDRPSPGGRRSRARPRRRRWAGR